MVYISSYWEFVIARGLGIWIGGVGLNSFLRMMVGFVSKMAGLAKGNTVLGLALKPKSKGKGNS